MSRWDPISSRTLKKFMAKVELLVEEAIGSQMPGRIGLVFDGWTSGTTYCVAVYAVYIVDGIIYYPLLALSPLVEESDLGANSHIDVLDENLETSQNSRSCIQFIVGDNCSTNQALATRLGVSLVGCASHRYNLAVQRFLREHEGLLEDVNALMGATVDKEERRAPSPTHGAGGGKARHDAVVLHVQDVEAIPRDQGSSQASGTQLRCTTLPRTTNKQPLREAFLAGQDGAHPAPKRTAANSL
ncbi:hypothetical protein PC116_g10142 [Phytophthora cactorum]|uniref:Uncharacterized protein n=1 Tax=Phytophthora cactorum TaxID=29920 RepID=A0A329S1F2_9STRA|nr:hypothetical protein Pcac1_g27783 [Phytophthora cactorum]KAG2907031.1 hypothetical protein PC114_g10960 [Phytophthora cactorum]KAG2940111.1 hypothetical protein PC117_g10672 [Phytophthora cactorum]KAG3014766.1 hypothetical protein PC120_g12515 [Phytophthora cactorum]KAG3019564.1 hypothetical protein PC119_g10258 [Phytophthora cactorum]